MDAPAQVLPTLELAVRPDVLRALEDLPKKLQAGAIRSALKAAGAPILQEALALVAVRSGRLKKSLKLRNKSAGKGRYAVLISATAAARAGRDEVHYQGFVEYGHRVARKATGLFRDIGRGEPTSEQINPRPYLRPAFDRNEERAVEVLSRELSDAIDAAWAR